MSPIFKHTAAFSFQGCGSWSNHRRNEDGSVWKEAAANLSKPLAVFRGEFLQHWLFMCLQITPYIILPHSNFPISFFPQHLCAMSKIMKECCYENPVARLTALRIKKSLATLGANTTNDKMLGKQSFELSTIKTYT